MVPIRFEPDVEYAVHFFAGDTGPSDIVKSDGPINTMHSVTSAVKYHITQQCTANSFI